MNTNYLVWNEKVVIDFSEKNIAALYDQGYVFTRKGKGVMHQTRSVRINLTKFSLSSENRRILKKAEHLGLIAITLPLGETDYDYTLGKFAKDFYEHKFGAGIMSAVKVKEMLTDSVKSNFNTMLRYTDIPSKNIIGHSICYMNTDILHYSYPFYDLDAPKHTGLGMMTLAIEFAKEKGLKYVYLGSLQRPADTYKLQFEGLEWFDEKVWSTDYGKVKKILASDKIPE